MIRRIFVFLLVSGLATVLLLGCARTTRQQAAVHIMDGNYGLAEPLLRKALDAYSLDQNAYLQLGIVYRHTGRERLARLVFQQIAREKPPVLVSEDTNPEFAGRPVAELANHYLEEMGEGPLYVSGLPGIEEPDPLARPDSVDNLEREILGEQGTGGAPPASTYSATEMVEESQTLEPVMHDAASQEQAFGVHVLSFKRALNVEGGKQKLLRRFPLLLAGKHFRSQRVDMGAKGVYHRLYTGPYATRAEAAQVCAQLKQAYGYCEVVPF